MLTSSPLDTGPAAAAGPGESIIHCVRGGGAYAGNPSYPEPLRLDVERYRAHLEGLDLTEEQAAEVPQTLWGTAEAFAGEAF